MNFLLKQGKFVIIASLILLGINACKKQETAQQKYDKEQVALANYLKIKYNDTLVPKASGLYYIETLKGTGVKASYGRLVTVNYTGRFLDGTVFESSDELNSDGIKVGPFVFSVGYGEVIAGWDEALQYMRDGGKATLIIPSSIGYGAAGNGNVPGYTTIIFDIEVINVL